MTRFVDTGRHITSHRIPYVRFDGKMNAKQRQDVLQRFSIPIEEGSSTQTIATSQAMPATQKRRTGRTSRIINDIDDENNVATDGADRDFVNGASDSGDSFLDDDEDSLTWTKKGKSRPKGKGKGKGKAKASNPKAFRRESSGEVPRVMLISLKAGALGLNLTVANNVYLYVCSTFTYRRYELTIIFSEWIRKRSVKKAITSYNCSL